MLRKLFSSLRNENRHWLETSEVKKTRDEKTGLFRYVRHDHSTYRKDQRIRRMRSYYTIGVESHVSYEEAKSRSMSFHFDLKEGDPLMEVKCVKRTHYNLGIENYIHKGMWVREYSDGSFFTDIQSGSSKTKSLKLNPKVRILPPRIPA
jgi:hypothetical protein